MVIGSGFGGLAAAVRLGAKGYRVTVLEKLDAPGGRAYVHRRGGYVFDAGPTIVTAPFLFEELWTLCGKRFSDDITLKPLDPFYRIRFDDGSWFDYSGDVQAMRREVARFAPQDLNGYDAFFQEAEKCYRLGFEGMASISFVTFSDLIAVLPDFMRMRAWKTIYSRVASFIRDPKLRMVFSFHPLLIGGNPFSVTCAYTLINALERRHGVHWAIGGTGALIQGLVGLIIGQGNSVRCESEVAEILVRNQRAYGVRLADGQILESEIVVSNADTAWTYRYLIPAEHRRHWTDAKIERTKFSMSLFVWYFGTRQQFHDIPHHMILMGPRYRELLADIFKRKILAKDFSLYLHRPSASDPSVAPPGHDTFYVLSPVPHLQSGVDWSVAAEPYRQAIAQSLHSTIMPGFEEHITESFITTPQDFQDRLLSFRGAAFGPEPVLTQSAWFRPHNKSEDIAGLFMVGASTHPGAGMPGVIASAKALESVIPDPKTMARAYA
ncbi:MAG: phytoene desaturase [Betaproteobacteria bacterium]|nr:phytoene desaturase [Betaproteobacteria bacterium]